MKKIILMIGLVLIVYSLQPETIKAQTYDSLASFTAVTSLNATDLMPMQIKVSNKYKWRKITGASLWSRMRDTTQAQLTTLLNTSNSWNGINNFDGATFNSGSHGKVTFSDSVIFASRTEIGSLYPYNATSFMGDQTDPFLRIYSKNFVLVNTAGTDSVVINVGTDGSLSIPNLTISGSMKIDSSATTDVMAFTPHSYTVPNTGDTILTLATANRYSLIELDLPGNMSPGISRLYVQGAQKGMIIRFYNGDASYSMEFEDLVGDDDNLYMAGDFASMAKYDYIEFQCVVESIVGQTWIETGRSNN